MLKYIKFEVYLLIFRFYNININLNIVEETMKTQRLIYLNFILLIFLYCYSVKGVKVITTELFSDGCILHHLEKTGGSFLRLHLNEFFMLDSKERAFHLSGGVKAIKHQTLAFRFSTGHVSLNDIVSHQQVKRPIITFLRNPIKRTTSFLRFCYSLSANNYPIFFNKDLNNLVDVEELIEKMPILCTYVSSFAPSCLNITAGNMDDSKLNACVSYTLENFAFIGNLDDLENSLHRLNLHLGISLNVEDIVGEKYNATPSSVMNITDKKVLDFLSGKLHWEFLFNERVFAGQRWRVATPILKQPGETREWMMQLILPEKFDPDSYLKEKGLELTVEKITGKKTWKKLEIAIKCFIAECNNETYNLLGEQSLPAAFVNVDFSKKIEQGSVSSTIGLSKTEETGVWSDGELVVLNFEEQLPEHITLHIIAHAFDKNSTTPVSVVIGEFSMPLNLSYKPEERIVHLSNPNRFKNIQFKIPHPTSPYEKGISEDKRRLGVHFKRMWIEAVDETE